MFLVQLLATTDPSSKEVGLHAWSQMVAHSSRWWPKLPNWFECRFSKCDRRSRSSQTKRFQSIRHVRTENDRKILDTRVFALSSRSLATEKSLEILMKLESLWRNTLVTTVPSKFGKATVDSSPRLSFVRLTTLVRSKRSRLSGVSMRDTSQKFEYAHRYIQCIMIPETTAESPSNKPKAPWSVLLSFVLRFASVPSSYQVRPDESEFGWPSATDRSGHETGRLDSPRNKAHRCFIVLIRRYI